VADGKTLANVLSFVGLFLLIYGFWRINKELIFPGKWALIPVIGTVLIIMAGSRGWVNRKILSNKVAVWFGLISFPLYLWHWPVLSFARIIEGEVPVTLRIGALVFSVVLAWLTYRLVECPIRFGNQGKAKVTVLIILMMVMGCVGYYSFTSNGFAFRQIEVKSGQQTADTKELLGAKGSDGSCQKFLNLNVPSDFVCLANSSHPKVLFIGDSHAMAINNFAYQNIDNQYETLYIGMFGCTLYGNLNSQAGRTSHSCKALPEFILNTLKHLNTIKKVVVLTRAYGLEQDIPEVYKHILISNQIQNESQKNIFVNGYSLFLSKLSSIKGDVVFVIDVPWFGKDPKKCNIKRPFALQEKNNFQCVNLYEKIYQSQTLYRQAVKEVQENVPELKIYDPTKIFCDETYCYGVRNGVILYYDNNHPSVSASKIILKDLLK
jgi:hypothetical protein